MKPDFETWGTAYEARRKSISRKTWQNKMRARILLAQGLCFCITLAPAISFLVSVGRQKLLRHLEVHRKCVVMKMKLILALALVGCIAFAICIEIQNLVVRQLTWSFISGNWVSLLSFAFSSISLYMAIVGYRYRTRARIKIDTSGAWDFDLQTETLETGDTTAIAVTKTGTRIESFIENSGGCATTLKKLEISKKRGLLKKSQRAEVIWRRDFILAQTDREGNLIQLSIWDRIEPGQRLKLILPYMLVLDLMATQNMLALNDRFQGRFTFAIKHVYGEAKSSEFQLFLSETLSSFISDRVNAFGRVIVRD